MDISDATTGFGKNQQQHTHSQVLIAAKTTYKKKGAPKTGTRKKTKCPDD